MKGYFAGPDGDISWHMVDEEFQELAKAASNSGNTLLFGRKTYQLMESFWPTPEALSGRREDSCPARFVPDSRSLAPFIPCHSPYVSFRSRSFDREVRFASSSVMRFALQS